METVLDLIITPDLFVFHEGNFQSIALPRTSFFNSYFQELTTCEQKISVISPDGDIQDRVRLAYRTIEFLEFLSRTLI